MSRTPLEFENANRHALISGRAILAGLLVSFFTMLGLIGLGLAMGGINMNEDTSLRSVGIFTGVWFIASALISLFAGSYFAARISKFRTGRIGSAQGLVIASVFLGFFLYQTFASIGAIGGAAGNVIQSTGSAVVQGAKQASQNPTVVSTVNTMAEDALGDLNLRSEPGVVAQGVATRLMRGDVQGAQTYLSRQSGITEAEAQLRINQLEAQVSSYVEEAKAAGANALQSMGWSLFLMVVLGGISAAAGGGLGAVANFRKPLIREGEAGYYPRGQVA